MIVVFNLSRRSKVCTRIPSAFTGATFSMTHLQYYFFFFSPTVASAGTHDNNPEKSSVQNGNKTSQSPQRRGESDAAIPGEAGAQRGAQTHHNFSPPDIVSSPAFSDPATQPHARAGRAK